MSAALYSPASMRLRLIMPCDLEKIRPFSRAVRDFLSEESVCEDEIAACELALVEACNNAVLYVGKTTKNQPVEIEVVCDETRVEVRVTDHTCGFKLPEKVHLPASPSESGRGLFIIQSIMDYVCYATGEGANTMAMTKLRLNSTLGKRLTPETLSEFSRKLAESEQIISDMAEELSSCYETLSAIFRCGVQLGKQNDLKEFARILCQDLLQIADADWYVLRIVSPEDPNLRLFVTSEKQTELKSLPFAFALAESEYPDSVELKAAITRRDVWFGAETPLPGADPLTTCGANSIGVVHPFFFADNLIGTLAVGKNTSKPEFTAAQANVVHTFADFLAIQVVNNRLREEQLKSRLISRELEIAHNIQSALLPRVLPQPNGFRLAGFCESARQVGGDFYDVSQVCPTSMLLIIADVMGKGIPAAMFAAILRSVLRAMPELNQQPAALLSRVNRLLFEDLSEVEMFITAQVAYLDFAARKIVAASAGHCPILLASQELQSIKTISPEGIPLGILHDACFTDQKEDLLPGSCVLLYTDGVTEAQDFDGNFFGQQELVDWFQRSLAKNENADEMKHSLAQRLREFRGNTPPYDDQTFLILTEENSGRRSYGRENITGG